MTGRSRTRSKHSRMRKRHLLYSHDFLGWRLRLYRSRCFGTQLTAGPVCEFRARLHPHASVSPTHDRPTVLKNGTIATNTEAAPAATLPQRLGRRRGKHPRCSQPCQPSHCQLMCTLHACPLPPTVILRFRFYNSSWAVRSKKLGKGVSRVGEREHWALPGLIIGKCSGEKGVQARWRLTQGCRPSGIYPLWPALALVLVGKGYRTFI